MPPSFLPTLSFLLAILSTTTTLLIHLTTASPFNTTSPLNLTLPNNLTNLTDPAPLPGGASCRLSSSWSTPAFNSFDCIENLENLWIHRVIGDEDEKYEFLTYGVQQRTRLMAMRVPMKWVYKSCALAIEMVETFPPEVLVPYPPGYPESDVATWGDISAAALTVLKLCLMDKVEPGMPPWTGWTQVGVNRGIGVFLWDRMSFANEFYNKEWGVGVGNGSVTAMPTAALAGFNATVTAVAGGEADNLVVNNGPVDTESVNTS